MQSAETTSNGRASESIQHEVNALGKSAKKLVNTVGAEAKARVDDATTALRDQSTDAYQSLATTIRNRPLVALSLAAVSGMVISSLLRSRH